MLGNRYSKKPRSKDDGEKPFWISFADLMTALMTLFLVVMAVSLMVVTKKSMKRLKLKINVVQRLWIFVLVFKMMPR